jgi:hypothetical protein
MFSANKKQFVMSKSGSILFLILLLIFLMPVVVYVATFGASLSRSHSTWAEFGSAMAGIYAPIVALTTLMVLLAQLGLQKQLHTHETDQAYIHQARSDIEFYCTQLVRVMGATLVPGKTTRAVLHEHFQPSTADELDDEKHRELAANIHHIAPEAVDLWGAIYPIFSGLTAGKTGNYQMTLNSSKQKLIAMLSYETCVCLDNLYRARTEGRINVDYSFSPLLSK